MTPMFKRIGAAFLIVLFAPGGYAFADVQLPGIISDHMLLQRDMPARIFGKAQAGEAVSVAFRGQTVKRRRTRWVAGRCGCSR